jgi:uncharacterized protein with PIN domain
MRFAVDAMLGRLAKWLRFMGYDTLYVDFSMVGSNNVAAMAAQGRVLVSRNRKHMNPQWPQEQLVIENNDPMLQLREVFDKLDVRPDPNHFFTRCTICNGLLETVGREEVRKRVPEYVSESHDRFSRCPGCDKIYWPGTHLQRGLSQIESILGIEASPWRITGNLHRKDGIHS